MTRLNQNLKLLFSAIFLERVKIEEEEIRGMSRLKLQ